MAGGGQWRYFAQRFDGTGNLGDFIDLNLPLQGVEITEVLSGHNSISATITPEILALKGSDGRPVFDEWGTCLWAESPNGEVYGGILEVSGFEGGSWVLDCTDISGVFIECPFDGSTWWSDVDPIDIFRWLWVWYQARPGCNFGVTTDMTNSPVRLAVGGYYVQGEDFDPAFADPEDPAMATSPSSYATNADWLAKAIKKMKKLKNGWSNADITNALTNWINTVAGDPVFVTPLHEKIVKRARKDLGEPPNPPGTPLDATPTVTTPPEVYVANTWPLNWYTNHDLSSTIDELATSTPFDWNMIHYWSDDGDEADLRHHIRIGYPKLGRKVAEGRFVIGENIHEVPSVERDGEEYANEVIVLGNGEGAATVRGSAYRPTPGKMRRTVLITDQTLTTVAACNARAEEELAARSMIEDVNEVVMVDHPHAPLGSVQLGDEFLLEGNTGWFDLSVWVRCVGRTQAPDDGSQMRLSVVRTDRLSGSPGRL